VGMTVAVVADRRRPRVASPTHLAGLAEDEGFSVPVLVTDSPFAGGAGLVAAAVEERLGDPSLHRIPRLDISPVGRDLRQSVALAASLSAAIARRGRRVFLYLHRGKPSLLDQSSVVSELQHAGPGVVTAGLRSPAAAPPVRLLDQDAGAQEFDVLVQVTDDVGPESRADDSERLIAVVSVVSPGATIHEVRSMLASLRRLDRPLLAIFYVHSSSVGRGVGRHAPAGERRALNGAPSRAEHEPSDAGPGRGPAQLSPADTASNS
jgi:hypothetical protein